MLLLFSFGKRWLLFFTSVLLGNNFLILVYFVPLKKKKEKESQSLHVTELVRTN